MVASLLFGNGEGGFSGWSNCKERLDAAITKANDGKPIPHWTLHDLRRTFATYAGGGLPAHQLEKLPKQDKEIARGLGIQPHVIEAVLNHVSGHKAGVAGIYNRSSYEREKRQALDLWADHLTYDCRKPRKQRHAIAPRSVSGVRGWFWKEKSSSRNRAAIHWL